jgi:1,4-dihydroxy-2-naphthoate octaprenyltransferase
MTSWINAMRLRTLPLSIAGIFTGGALAYRYAQDNDLPFSFPVFIMAVLTALLLQILSNFANDYGDFEKGTDNDNRKGPARALQSGAITKGNMQMAILFTAILALASGIALLYLAFGVPDYRFLFFLVLGLAGIGAAIKYTMGKNPYGYKGLGDIFVFIFFGLVSCCGVFVLLVHILPPEMFLPATSIGALSTAVLNLNNLRDIDNDKASGKVTIPVRIGMRKGLIYHYFLIAIPFISNSIFAWTTGNMTLLALTGFSMLPAFILFRPLFNNPDHKQLDLLLKKTAMFTLLFTVLFVCGILV